MSKKSTIAIHKKKNGSLLRLMAGGKTQAYTAPTPDWAALDALSDAALTRAAKADKNSQPLTYADIKNGKLLPIGSVLKNVRKKLGLSQKKFAERYQLSLGTLRDWEQGRYLPDGPALTYLKIISKHPMQIASLLTD